MRIGEVDYMDVIAQAGAVRRSVVVTKDRDMVALAQGNLQDKRNQMRSWNSSRVIVICFMFATFLFNSK
jgi:hypothetical protein